MLRLVTISLIILTFLSIDLSAQRRFQPVEIETRRSRDGDQVEFYAQNRTNVPYTIEITFTNYQNTIPPRNPYYSVADAGRSTLLRLRKSGAGAGSIGYNYRYRWYRGCYDAEPDTDIEYLLPVADGDQVDVRHLSNINNYLQEEKEGAEKLGHSFRVSRGDTIFAVRKGKVAEVSDQTEADTKNLYNREQNYVEIVHEDCTFARYRQIRKGSIMLSAGDDVYPGDPIGIVADAEEEGQEYFNITYSFSRLKELIEMGIDPTTVSTNDFYMPAYRTESGEKKVIENGEKVTAVHSEAVITQEMSRRERRRYRRRNR